MSQKFKSSLYFAGLVFALLAYYQVDTNDTIQNNEMVTNTVKQVSPTVDQTSTETALN